LEPEVVPPVETGVEDETAVASVVGVVAGTTTGGVLVVVGIMTAGFVEVVGAGAAEELSSMKIAPREDEEVVAGAWVGMGVLEMVGAAEVDAGTRTGVPSIVTVAMASGAPVAKDPSAASVTMICSVTITLSVTTYRSLFRTSYRPAKTSLTSKEEAKMARLEKVDERIFVTYKLD
jgi:hypothetical protein